MEPGSATSGVTLRTVAEAAGVSVATVSRVLNVPAEERSRWASAATIARVLAAAEALGYRKNTVAASLRSQQTHLVGVLVPRLQDFVLATVYEGIDEAAGAAGFMAMVTNTLDHESRRKAHIERLLERRVDGLILCDARIDDPLLDQLDVSRLPFVLAWRRSGAHPFAVTDEYLGGALVAHHLIERGRTRLALIAGRPYASTTQQRQQGFLDAAESHGVKVPQERIAHVGFDTTAGAKGMRALLDGGMPDGVFAMNDFAAIGALGVLRAGGYSVPDDVALAGYNDTPLVANGGVPLTSVRSPLHEVGLRAFEMLQELRAGKDVTSTTFEPELVIRESTG